MKLVALIEKTRSGYSAYLPDIDGCVAAGRTLKATEKLIREAADLHIASLREAGVEIPEPKTFARVVEVAA
jgi:predicted RNase H-like HicB family nuclease